MLVEFSVQNFRSIKERQTLSMVTSATHTQSNRCVYNTGFHAAPSLLENTAIYGPNGAGKSNLIKALEFFQDFVISSHKLQPNEQIKDITPFLFSKDTQNEPSLFESVFIHEGYLFQYGFTVDSNKVYEEWLYATPKGSQKQKLQTWYERNTVIKKDLVGAKKTWEKETGENQLFLSIAANRQSEDFKKPFSWIQNRLRIITDPERLDHGYTHKQIYENGKKSNILKIMHGFDVSFEDIEVIEKTYTEADIKGIEKIPAIIKDKILKDVIGKKHLDAYSRHKLEQGGHYLLPFKEESDGTRQLYALAGPILDVLENGYTLIVDEIHNSLHPLALKGVISLFNNKKINKNNAQLIFTTHDTNAMNYLERDQIWLLDKGEFGETTFTALSEFNGRSDEPIEKRYLGGRYGALPNIKGLIEW